MKQRFNALFAAALFPVVGWAAQNITDPQISGTGGKVKSGATLTADGTINVGSGGAIEATAAKSGSALATAISTAQSTAISTASSDATSKANAAQAYAIQRGNHTGTQAISSIAGLQTALDARASTGPQLATYVEPPQAPRGSRSVFAELYKPSLVVGDLTSASGLSTHGSGGVAATTGGVSGTGYLPLTETINPAKPFRVTILAEANDSNGLTVQLTNGSNSGVIGMSVTVSTAYITAVIGGSSFLNQYGYTGGVTAGTKIWINVIGDGRRISATVCRDGDYGSNTGNVTFQAALANQVPIRVQAYDAQNYNSSAQTWANLSRIYISTTSATSRVIGVYVSHRGIGGPGDASFAPYGAFFRPSVLRDTQCMISLPPLYGGDLTTPLILVHHPNGNLGDYGFGVGTNPVPLLAALNTAGYVLASVQGSQATADYAGPTSSNWAGPTGMWYRRVFYDWVRGNLVGLGSTQHLGVSMGALTALTFHRQWPWIGRSIVGISGSVDLTASLGTTAASLIKAGFGTWYVCTQAGTGQTPSSSPTYWTKIADFGKAPAPYYYGTPFMWRNTYNAGTAYSVNDIVCVPSTAANSAFAPYDPVLNPALYLSLPIHLWHGDSDSVISIAQATAFTSAANAAGGNVTLTTVTGAGHIDTAMFDTPVSAAVVAFFDLYR